MRAYLAFLRGAVLVGMVYRVGFLFTALGNMVYMVVAYFLWRSIYNGTAVIHGLTFDQALLYVALGSTVFILLKTFADWGMAQEIRDGTVSVFLTKPIDYQLYTFFTNLGFPLTSLITVIIWRRQLVVPRMLGVQRAQEVLCVGENRPNPEINIF